MIKDQKEDCIILNLTLEKSVHKKNIMKNYNFKL